MLGAKKPRTLDAHLDNEFIWLQIRKIIELVTYAGITADEERYAALRAETAKNPDYTQDWKVNQILPRLVKITPHYLPIPIDGGTRQPNGLVSFLEAGPEQTLERFLEIYNLAGSYLHITNPFSPTTAAEAEQAKLVSRERAKAELAYLKAVLWVHAKVGLEFDEKAGGPTEAANPKMAWLVKFGVPKPNDVEVTLAEGIDPPEWADDEPSTSTI